VGAPIGDALRNGVKAERHAAEKAQRTEDRRQMHLEGADIL
jgi:hypothetical protein